ncbi:hypothetical protein MTR67_038662 [Solanum verrucosum]|uniref:Reverse transcriptase/retrotransposon-derived protein RNase H-like domain-containing protein n=1 Tax=Solanum verrucosum TaxID=315347 RepID=A0AAF0UFV2_SOLVR|nr:hypothetical protein MTR67_038662 [Solanum verrucosum]
MSSWPWSMVGVRRDGQAKALAKRGKNLGSFQGSYSKRSERPTVAARPIQSVMLDSTEIPGREKLKWERVYKPKQAKIISSIRASKLVEQGCLAYLSNIRDAEVESPSIESILVVSEFREVFHNDLPGMTPDRDIDICIDLEPGTRPISIPPYRMAPAELRELKAQIQELLDKRFIHPSASPWGAPVLFVKKMDGTEVRSFVGLASYYRRFVKNFVSIGTNLTNLTKKEIPFEWTKNCEESFQKLKTLSTTTPILALPVEGKDLIVYCDASHFGLGVVLM